VCRAGFVERGTQWVEVASKPAVPATTFRAFVPANSIGSLTATRIVVEPSTIGNYRITTEVTGVSGDRFQSKVSAGNATAFTFNNSFSTPPSAGRTLTIRVEISSEIQFSAALVRSFLLHQVCVRVRGTLPNELVPLGRTIFR
jgi:hypothetical protein